MPVSAEMKTHLQGTATVNVFVTITAKDGSVVRFNNGTRNKIIGGNTYYAIPLDPSQLKSTSSLNPDNADVEIILTGLLSRANLIAGKWAGARVEYETYNYMDFTMGVAEKRIFYLGNVEVGRYTAKPELNSLMQKLNEQTGFTQLETCNAQFGDSRCAKSLAGNTEDGHPIRQTAVVTAVTNRQQFEVNYDTDDTIPNDFYREGLCEFITTGSNVGFDVKILANTSNALTLFVPAPFTIAVNDIVRLTTGCDKLRTTCRDKFNNIINNRSFWMLPGRSKLVTLP